MTSNVVHSNNRIQTNTGFMVIEGRNPELDENIESNDLDQFVQVSTKQRRTVDRLKDPIVDKTKKRKPKTNLNAFKSQFLTLKKKISALQMEVGTEPDFLLLVRNNLQSAQIAKPSKMAGKYMAFGQGDLSDRFFSSGIKFDANKMYKLANNFNYEEETLDTLDEAEDQESTNITRGENRNASTMENEQPKTAHCLSKAPKNRPKNALKPTNPITPVTFRPRKVFTPGFFDDCDDNDESEEETGTVSKGNQDLQNFEGMGSSIEI